MTQRLPTPPASGLSWLNTADDGPARRALLDVCACRAWAGTLLRGRPYPDPEALLAAADAAVAALTAEELAEALAGHPPIGRPAPGDPRSAREQRGMAGAAPALRAEMLRLNLAYQERFGHVFLICATGLTAGRLLDAVRERLGNPPETEREIVRTELGRINRIRLGRLLRAAAPAAPAGPEEGHPR
ncbi:2-oxo-4-hydroxy-4-carboxy-5-ureidoimidazoline decarboxylase [Streptomyces aidingensis]|uniref:2-oxo-4-hydroxy-4-carboxy-5-ureidoimidazoline decarboxylase n=1 Tax=Streptomyces aidingensis TaxID=910347 RepID=A0A1I1ISV7_9ACTN|nr:2-oxo-4-hydroxy-4-carboxy-5-ureidoimidazoline decarboxylase [Streptomyces aidingensis]SFC39306.1 2-oxo-4-hydroxy-4-carboxy-5-ureidoimidazoline decarboxylase [Streptomyces aidingensis]